jgi:hypothetical protein
MIALWNWPSSDSRFLNFGSDSVSQERHERHVVRRFEKTKRRASASLPEATNGAIMALAMVAMLLILSLVRST